jgi:hypothetical protein
MIMEEVKDTKAKLFLISDILMNSSLNESYRQAFRSHLPNFFKSVGNIVRSKDEGLLTRNQIKGIADKLL